MVLVFCIPYNHTSILQTKFSHRERHEARRIGLETIPLDQDIEGGHGEREPRLKIGPYAVHDSLEMADERQHGEHRLDEQAVLPLATQTEFAPDNPPMVGEAFAADLLGTAAFAHRVDQLDAVGVDDPEHGRGG